MPAVADLDGLVGILREAIEVVAEDCVGDMLIDGVLDEVIEPLVGAFHEDVHLQGF
jgi:hypothetical protein